MTKLEIGTQISDEYLRDQTLKAFRKSGVTLQKIAKRIFEGLNATETKTNYDKDRGRWAYSSPLVDWSTRAKAIDQAISILDIKPAEKHDVNVTNLEDVLRSIDAGK